MKRRSNCLCGYEGRVDHVNQHKLKCKAYPIIEKLESEKIQLETQCTILKTQLTNPESTVALKIEIEKLRKDNNKLHESNEKLHAEIYKKNAKIQKLMKEPKNVTNNFNILNICPFGQEPPIQHEDVKPLLTLPAKSVPKYIQMKHFTSSDTKNVCLTNVRGNTIQVVEEDQYGTRKWVQHRGQSPL